MRRFRTRALIVMVGVLALVAAGCGSDDEGGGDTTGATSTTGSTGDTVCATNATTGDLLADICERGEIKV